MCIKNLLAIMAGEEEHIAAQEAAGILHGEAPRTVREHFEGQREFAAKNPRPSFYPEDEFAAATLGFLAKIEEQYEQYAGNVDFVLDWDTQRKLNTEAAEAAFEAGEALRRANDLRGIAS
jgi:hypothetical protein